MNQYLSLLYNRVSKPIDLESFIYSRFNLRNMIVSPLAVTFSIENRCNLNCIHCWDKIENLNKLRYEKPTFTMVTKALDTLSKFNILHIVLTGGEIFLRDDILDIIKYAKSKKFVLTLLTNGVLLNIENINELRKILDIRTDIVQVSLDGFSDNHNLQRNAPVFDKVIKNIISLTDIGIKTRVHFVATKNNTQDILPLYMYLNNIGIHTFSVFPVYGMGRGKTLASQFDYLSYLKVLYDLKQYSVNEPCSTELEYVIPVQCYKYMESEQKKKQTEEHSSNIFLKHYLSNIRINIKGDIFPGNMYEDKFCIGNIYIGNIRNFYEGSIYEKILNGRDLSRTKCNLCSFMQFCQGGDLIRTYEHYNDWNYSDPECTIKGDD